MPWINGPPHPRMELAELTDEEREAILLAWEQAESEGE